MESPAVKRAGQTLLVLTVLAGFAMAGCQSKPQPNRAAEDGKDRTIVIGYTASLTGALNVESTRQDRGLKLWMQRVNSAGGLRLKSGTVVRFDSTSYDDESSKDRVQELYTRLATQDGADFLISPYSSGLADAAAVVAEQYGKIMVTTGAASDSTFEKGYKLVYQSYTPASRYLTGAIDILAKADPEVRRIAIVSENDRLSSDVGKALQAYALEKGYEVVLSERYDTGTTDFAPFLNKIQSAAPGAILGGGHFQDGSTLAKQLREKKVPIRFLALLVAPPEITFAELGDAAVGVVGPSQWEPQLALSPEAAKAASLSWIGPPASEFVRDYQAAHREEPSYHAAGGFAAGLILQNAIETAGSVDGAAVRAALDQTDILTFFGRTRFDTSPRSHGLQVGHSMVYVQWQRGGDGKLAKQVVWPPEGATAPLLYPIP